MAMKKRTKGNITAPSLPGKDMLAEVNNNEAGNIYNSLFKACILFRKVGMAEAEDLGFEYDRQTDVKTLKLLRNNYKKLESFLN